MERLPVSHEPNPEMLREPAKRESLIKRWKRRQHQAEVRPNPESARESRVRRFGRAMVRLVTRPSAERYSEKSEVRIVAEKAKRVGRWAVFLVTGVRAEVWRSTASQPLPQRRAEIQPLARAERNLTGALHELDAATGEKRAESMPGEDDKPLAKVYAFPAPRHPERQAADDTSNSEQTVVKISPDYHPPYEVNNTEPYYQNEITGGAGKSAMTVAEAMRRISTDRAEKPPVYATLAMPVAVAAAIGASRNREPSETRVLQRENKRHQKRLAEREFDLRTLQAKRPDMREPAARQAYVGQVATFANRQAAEIREIAHEVRIESVPANLQPKREHATIPVKPAETAAPVVHPVIAERRQPPLNAEGASERLRNRSAEVEAAVQEMSEKQEDSTSHEVTEREIGSRIEQLDRDKPGANGQNAAADTVNLARQSDWAPTQAHDHAARARSQQQQLQTVSYAVLVLVTAAMLFAALVWL